MDKIPPEVVASEAQQPEQIETSKKQEDTPLILQKPRALTGFGRTIAPGPLDP